MSLKRKRSNLKLVFLRIKFISSKQEIIKVIVFGSGMRYLNYMMIFKIKLMLNNNAKNTTNIKIVLLMK
jgi:hypothetical protein